MRILLITALLGACSGEDGPHDEVLCDSSWAPAMPRLCERACRVFPNSSPVDCSATRRCVEPVTVDGVLGCCELEGTVSMGLIVRWNECE